MTARSLLGFRVRGDPTGTNLVRLCLALVGLCLVLALVPAPWPAWLVPPGAEGELFYLACAGFLGMCIARYLGMAARAGRLIGPFSV